MKNAADRERRRKRRVVFAPLTMEVLEQRLLPASGLITIETVTATDTTDDQRISFGGVKVGSTSTVDITVRNISASTITLGSWVITAAFSTTPTNSASLTSDDVAILPGGTTVISVTFSPTAQQNYSGNLYISSNDPLESVLTVALDGHGRLADLVQTATFNKSYPFIDSDGDLTVLSFRGGGQADVKFTDFNGVGVDIDTITFTGTTTTTKYRVASTGQTPVGTITDVPLTGIGLGDLYVQGDLGSLTFLNPIKNVRVTGEMGSATIAGTVGLFEVGSLDGTLNFSTTVKTLRINGDARGAINIATTAVSPAALKVLSIAGRAGNSASDPLDLSIKGTIGAIQVLGPMFGNYIATGSIGNIAAASITAKISAGYGLDGLRNGDPTEAAATIGKVNTFLGNLLGTIQATSGISQIGSAGTISTTVGVTALYGNEIYTDASIGAVKSVGNISKPITAVGNIASILTRSVDHTADGDLTSSVTAAAIQSVILEGLFTGSFSTPPLVLVIDSDGDGV